MGIFDYEYYYGILIREFDTLDEDILLNSISYAFESFLWQFRNDDRNEIKEPHKWILTVARYYSYRYLQWRKNFTEFNEQIDYTRSGIQGITNLTDKEREEYYDYIFDLCMGSLKGKDRDVFYLYYYESVELKEIAKKLDISESAAYLRHSRLLKKLQEILRHYPPWYE